MILAPCPCGSAESYQECCQPFHLSNALPQTPEALMRSRYCAFVKNDCHYIYATHSPSTRQQVSIESIEQWNNQCQWLGLNIRATPQTNIVEFVAWYKQDGQLQNHHEISRFEKQLMDDELSKRFDKQESSCWYYVDATYPQQSTAMPKRNDSCICHSGKKFKKCCGN